MNTASVIKRHIQEIFKTEGLVRVVCDKHTYYMDKDRITAYEFDDYGVSLVGQIDCTYQACCTFGMVYIPFESITTLTGGTI